MQNTESPLLPKEPDSLDVSVASSTGINPRIEIAPTIAQISSGVLPTKGSVNASDPLSSDFDPSLMVRRIRSAMTEPLRTEPLKPYIPVYKQVDHTHSEQQLMQTMSPLPPLIKGNIPDFTLAENQEHDKTEQVMSKSRDLVPTNAPVQDALNKDHPRSRLRMPLWMIAGASAVAATIAVTILIPSLRQANTQHTSALSDQDNSDDKRVATKNNESVSLANGAAVGGAAILATSSANASNENNQTPTKATTDTPKSGAMGQPLSAPIQPAQNYNEIPSRPVKTVSIPSNAAQDAPQQKLQQNNAINQQNIEKPSTFSAPAKNTEKVSALKSEPKIINASSTPVKVQVKVVDAPIEKTLDTKKIDKVTVAANEKPVDKIVVTAAIPVANVPLPNKPLPTAVSPVSLPTNPSDKIVTTADARIKQGAIIDARMLLLHAVEQGNGLAAFRLAETYDQRMLESWSVRGGVRGDVSKARLYYQQALDKGITQASQRLNGLK